MSAPIAQIDNSPSSTSVSTSTMTSVSSQINQKTEPIFMPKKPQVFSTNSSTNSSTSDIIFSSSSSKVGQRKCLISVWSTWYCLLVVALQAYILSTNFTSLINLFRIKSQSDLSNKPDMFQQHIVDLNNQIYFELVSRLVLLSLSIVFLIIFLLASLKPLGNYSNDGIKFGRDFFFEKLMHNHISRISISHTSLDTDKIPHKTNCWFGFTGFFELLWRHFLPISHVCHLVSLLMLFFSRIVFINSITNSFNAIMNCSSLQAISIKACVDSVYNESSLSIDILSKSGNPFDNTGFIIHQIDQFKFELASLILALVSIYIRYGSVFWFANKSLSLFVTFIGIISSIVQLSQIYSFIYIFFMIDKHELSPSTSQLQDTTVLIRNKLTLLFVYLILSLLVYLSATPAYVFSFLKYKEEYLAEESRFVRAFKNLKLSVISGCEKSQKHDIAELNHQQIIASTCCFNYCPHLIATIQLVVICVCKLPLCYDYVVYFNKFKDLGIMLVIIVEILHIIILIFIWLLLTLKTNWKMNLQTEFSICHWTYHLKFIKTSYFNDPHSIFKHLNESKKTKINTNADQMWSDDDASIEKVKFNPNEMRSKSAMQSIDYQQADPEHRQKSDYEAVFTNRHANTNDLVSQVPLRRNVVTIKNNTNKSTQFKSHGIGNYQNQSRDWLDSKHKSLYAKASDYVTECEPIMSPIKTNSDYILNSETIYRNQLRKSCKDLLQPINQTQLMRPQATMGSNGITLPIYNQAQSNFNPLLEYENPRALMDPFFYNNIDQKAQIEGKKMNFKSGVYLSATAPQIFDSTTNVTKVLAVKKQQNMPSVNKIVSNTNTSGSLKAKPPVDSNSKVNKEMSSTGNLAKSMIYLERPTNTANEYESRV